DVKTKILGNLLPASRVQRAKDHSRGRKQPPKGNRPSASYPTSVSRPPFPRIAARGRRGGGVPDGCVSACSRADARWHGPCGVAGVLGRRGTSLRQAGAGATLWPRAAGWRELLRAKGKKRTSASALPGPNGLHPSARGCSGPSDAWSDRASSASGRGKTAAAASG